MSRSTRPAPVPLELAAALLVPAATFGFTRVFLETGAITPIVGAALLSTAVSVLLRRIRVPLSIAAVLSTFFLFALIINRFAPGTDRLGFLPTSATGDRFQAMFDELVLNFQELKTPVEALDPFIAAAMIGAWVMAFLTDWGALRLRLAFEPVLPAGLLFMFSAVLGEGTRQIGVTLLFGAAVAIWAVTQRSINMAEGNAWLANDRRRGSVSIAQTAAVFAAAALLTGVIIGPRLPGASAEEMLSFRDAGDPTRVVVSPFVNIESRLVEQTGVQLFTVTSERPSYWRLAGLDTYEDNIWKVAGNFSPQDGRLPGQEVQGGTRDDIRQDYSIDALDAIWLPAAFAPAEIVEATANVTWNAETSSLTVANDVVTSDGVDYSLVSSIPRFTVEELRGASDFVPSEVREQYLSLPQLPSIVRDEALRITAAAPTRYDKMLALQNHFRSFDYSVNLNPRVGDPIEQFLSERVGFCQQFAGTFALMARMLDVPARVAIGFTWGDPIGRAEDGRTIYQVTGRQTHAWPEVWFDDLGWVAFEPTPGRGAPSAANYTEVAALQDSLVQPDNPNGPITTTTTAPSDNSGTTSGDVIPDIPLNDQGGSATTLEDGGLSGAAWLRILVVLAILGAYFGGLPAWHWFQRQQRRQKVTNPAEGVETSWAEATETLELGYGMSRRPAETRREYANRLGGDMRVPREPIRDLAEKVTVARYYPAGLSNTDAALAEDLAAEIETAVNDRVPVFTRWKRMVDPRRVLRPSARISPTSPLPSITRRRGSESNGSRPKTPVG